MNMDRKPNTYRNRYGTTLTDTNTTALSDTNTTNTNTNWVSRMIGYDPDPESSDHCSSDAGHGWLDRLASPGPILMATIATAIIQGALIWALPLPEYIGGASEIGREYQESKLFFAGCIALIFSALYPLYDQILDTIWLYQSSNRFSPARDLNKSSDTFTESTFLVERWILVIEAIVVPFVIVLYLDPSRDPSILMRLISMYGNTLPLIADGCIVSIMRQSSKFLTAKITILIWVSRIAVAFVLRWSESAALRGVVSLLSMMVVLNPIVNSFKEHYFKGTSGADHEDVEKKKIIFENRFIATYYFLFLFLIMNLLPRINNAKITDNAVAIENSVISSFITAIVLPVFALLCNPKRLYSRWHEDSLNTLYKHSTKLLEGMLPGKVLAHFRHSNEPFVERFDCVTILFVDIMDYTVVCRLLTPAQIVLLLDAIFHRFDQAAIARGVYRVETVGDCYMASTGCPDAEDPSVAAERMVLFAQDLIKVVRDFQPPCNLGFPLQIRIGIHSGPVVAGTLSGKMLRYCLFGDTVNTASRMENSGEVGRIHLSETTMSLIRKGSADSYEFESRLPMHIKGKGVMSTYFLNSPEDTVSPLNSHFRDFRSKSEREGTDAHIILRSLSISPTPFSFMGLKPISNLNLHKPRIKPIRIESVSEVRRMLVVPINDYDLELGGDVIAIPKPSVSHGVVPDSKPSGPMDSMAFVMASSLLSWDFDVQNIVSKDMLIDISFMLFQTSWICGPLGVSEVTLRNFIESVAGSYHSRSFHNFQHAVSVLHTTALLTNYCNQKRSCTIISYCTISSLARLALMVGALVHDCDHPGHTNSFEVGTNSALAQQYGNIAVLEQHHLSVAESVLSKPGCNILETFDEETATMFKELLKYIVMGTDMSLHKEIVSEIENFDIELDTEREQVASMFARCRAILHTADLSNPVKAFGVSKAWAIRLADEHTKQVQAEAALGLPSAQFMVHKDTLSVYKGEIQFLTFVAQPLWAAMAKTWPQLNQLYEELQLNIKKYQDLISKASEDELRIATLRV